jgi:hypothetical protein
MVGRGGTKEETMNAKPTRMLFAAVALSALAAVLASSAQARIPEGNGTQPPSTTVVDQQQASQGTELLEPRLARHRSGTLFVQQTSVREKLGEIGAWAVPSSSLQKPQLLQQTSVREKLGEIGAWAVLDPAIKGAIRARSK